MSPLINSIGNSSVALSIGSCLFGIILFYASRSSSSDLPASLGRGSVYGNFVLMTIANLAMIYALLANDFGVSYVAHVGSRATPRWISAISLWSSLEGSILFWGWILSAYSAVCIYRYREKAESFFLWVGMILLIVQLFFSILIAIPASPFLPVSPIPPDGPGPNPLLQNHWLMAIHPPCLYMGYIGMTIPFAFAIAQLMEGPSPPAPLPYTGEGGRRPGEGYAWTTLARPWILFAWSFLSMAIVLGGWWSYAVLGWGGYWAWDPVENASFMPWLTATALLHSVIVQEKRRILPVWNLTLAILTFLLTLLGTFLTRSGVLDSVHSFTESHIGPYFLAFIGLCLIYSLWLLLWKGPSFRGTSPVEPGRIENLFSLEVLFLLNNLLFVSFCFVVFLGTLYPLAVEAIRGTRISIGEPYFNQMTLPLVGMILLVMGVGLATPWKKGDPRTVLRMLQIPIVLSLLSTLAVGIAGIRQPVVLMILFLAMTAFLYMAFEMGPLLRRRGLSIFRDNARRYGGFVAHTGALMIIVAVAISKGYGEEKELTLKKGETASFSSYALQLEEIRGDETPQRYELKAILGISKGGKTVGYIVPQMNFYPSSREPIGSPAVRSTWREDLYLTLIHVEKDGSGAAIRAILTPAVSWIWVGGLITMLGGLIGWVTPPSLKRSITDSSSYK